MRCCSSVNSVEYMFTDLFFHVGKASGSARVKLGATDVIASVKVFYRQSLNLHLISNLACFVLLVNRHSSSMSFE